MHLEVFDKSIFIFKLTISFEIYKYFKSIYLDKTFDIVYFLLSLGNTCMTSYTFEVMNKFWDRRNSFILFLLGNVNKYKYIVCVACNKKYAFNSKFQKLGSNVGHNIFDFCLYNIVREVIFILFTFLSELCSYWIGLATFRTIFEI